MARFLAPTFDDRRSLLKVNSIEVIHFLFISYILKSFFRNLGSIWSIILSKRSYSLIDLIYLEIEMIYFCIHLTDPSIQSIQSIRSIELKTAILRTPWWSNGHNRNLKRPFHYIQCCHFAGLVRFCRFFEVLASHLQVASFCRFFKLSVSFPNFWDTFLNISWFINNKK